MLVEEGRVRAGKLLSQDQHVESMEGCTEGLGFNRTVPEEPPETVEDSGGITRAALHKS